MGIRARFTSVILALFIGTACAGEVALHASNDKHVGIETIFGNTAQNVTLCMTYGLGTPIPGVTFYFWFFGGGYFGTVNGMPSGNYTPPTGSNGCVTVEVVTERIQPTPPSGSPTQFVRFSTLFQGTTYEKKFHFVYNDPALSLSTNSIGDVPAQLVVSIYPPDIGIRIVADCHGTGGATPYYSPTVRPTNAAGHASFQINGSGLEVAVPSGPQPTASCTFHTETGGINTATVEIRAVNVCTLGLSPADPRCG